MSAPNLKWLRVRNWAVFAALVPVTFIAALVLSPVIAVLAAVAIVDENMRGGLK